MYWACTGEVVMDNIQTKLSMLTVYMKRHFMMMMFQRNPRGYTVFTALQTLIELAYTQVLNCMSIDDAS